MTSHSGLTIRRLLFAGLLLGIGGPATSPCFAAIPQTQSEGERYVLEELRKGADVDLTRLLEGMRELSAEFFAALLTNRVENLKLKRGLLIRGAIVKGLLDLKGEEIPYDVSLYSCSFDWVDFTDSHFAKGLTLLNARFTGPAIFDRATVGFDFTAGGSAFAKSATFKGMRTGDNFDLQQATFTDGAVFTSVRVGGTFSVDDSHFVSAYSWFDQMRVDGDFSAENCAFGYREGESKPVIPEEWQQSTVSFAGSRFGNFFLNGATFNKISTIDLTRIQTDLISLERVQSATASNVKHEQMSFKLVRPMNAEQLTFLLTPYDAELYTTVEGLFRAHGYADEADKIYVAKKRAERNETCPSFLHQCHLGPWGLSMFQDVLAGYGKNFKNLLYWSLGFLLLGAIVFRSEKGMRLKDEKDAPHRAGRYQAIWYSLDLFLPIIKLGEADAWTPKDNRRWARLYRKVHIIVGSLFVPIGLAAWTGIIK